MALSDALNAERSRKTKGPACQVCALLDTLPEPDATDLRTALSDFAFTGEGIARALAAEGYDIQGQTVQRHRRRKCRGAL